MSNFLQETTIHGLRYLHPSNHALARLLWTANIMVAAYFCSLFMRQAYREAQVNPIITTLTSKHFSELPFPQVTVVPDHQRTYLMRANEKHLNSFQFDCNRLEAGEAKQRCLQCSTFVQKHLGSTILAELAILFRSFIINQPVRPTGRDRLCSSHGDVAIQEMIANLMDHYELTKLQYKLAEQAAKSSLEGKSYEEMLLTLKPLTKQRSSNLTCDQLFAVKPDVMSMFAVLKYVYRQERPPLPLGSLVSKISLANKDVVDTVYAMNLTLDGVVLNDLYQHINKNKYCCLFRDLCFPCTAPKHELSKLTNVSLPLGMVSKILRHGLVDVVRQPDDEPLQMGGEFKFLQDDCALDESARLQIAMLWLCKVNERTLKDCFSFEHVPVDVGYGYKLKSDRNYELVQADKTVSTLKGSDEVTLFIHEKSAAHKYDLSKLQSIVIA